MAKTKYTTEDKQFVRELRNVGKLMIHRPGCEAHPKYPGEAVQAPINKVRVMFSVAYADDPKFRWFIPVCTEREQAIDMSQCSIGPEDNKNNLGWLVAIAALQATSKKFREELLSYDDVEKFDLFINKVVPN